MPTIVGILTISKFIQKFPTISYFYEIPPKVSYLPTIAQNSSLQPKNPKVFRGLQHPQTPSCKCRSARFARLARIARYAREFSYYFRNQDLHPCYFFE